MRSISKLLTDEGVRLITEKGNIKFVDVRLE